MKKSEDIDRLENMPAVYSKMNVSEILDQIEALSSSIMNEPGMEIDALLGCAEETIDLVHVLRAHFGIPIPDYTDPSNERLLS
jgi:hypothetical protein